MISGDVQRRRRRAAVLLAGYGAALLALLLRVGQLQVGRHEDLARLSDRNRLRPRVEQPTRGRIYDRKNRILVDNRPSWTVTLAPVVLGEQERTIRMLAGILEMDPGEITARLAERRGHLYTPVPIKRDVRFEVVARIKEREADMPGVEIQMEPRRRYPYGQLGAHMLGYLREIDDGELGRRQMEGQDYIFGDLVGRDGIERAYEPVLRGAKGVRYMEVDARGRSLRRAEDRPGRSPDHGDDLVTTIDAQVQLAAQEAFHDTARGSVVAIDPRDGALIVLASVPEYDPMDFSGVLDSETWRRLQSDPSKPLLDRTIAGLYPPASTFKVVTALAGLQSGVITPDTRLDPCVPGGWRFGTRHFKCWTPDHGRLTVRGALEQSCDVFFYQVGVRVGLDELHRTAAAFGIGETTGLAVHGEMEGSFPDRAWYDRRLGAGRWNPSSQVINLSIGQGEVLATPLQVAVMTAAFANGGKRVTPFLTRYRIPREGGPLVPMSQPAPEPIPAVDPSALEVVREGMVRVMNGEEGTARYLAPRLPGITVAGKTGTGQNPHGEDHAWF
ncbi:MAG: penicillin-binding protein 2, partial [bacterium]